KAAYQTRLLSGAHNTEQAAAIAKEIEDLTTEYEQVQAQIRLKSPRYAALTQPQPLSLKEIQTKVLDRDTLLLEYALGKERSYLWAVTTDSLQSFELPARVEIERAARRAYELLTARNRRVSGETTEQKRARVAQSDAEYLAAISSLSRMLLGPLASQLGRKRLLIVSDGALQFIPFTALPSPAAAGDARSGQKPPLIVEHEIVSLPSASTLVALRRETEERQAAAKTIAVIADPVFEPTDERVMALAKKSVVAPLSKRTFSPTSSLLKDVQRALEDTNETGLPQHLTRLLGTSREAQEIASLVAPQERLLALDFTANRALAMSPELSRYRILHFATHAFINSVHPELSGIVLSLVNEQGQTQDGFLRVHEIFNLKLPADLVVLSACRTGLGKEVKGEGLVGMTRGFMYAGTPRVVVSLWSLSDRPTAELMTRFYRKMLGVERLSPSAALRAAQIEMWKEKRWEAAYFWAAFTLQGEWKGVGNAGKE
ncbi:MAG: CHAT domain-containing protein, partial [Pyrinomonadaceae bacterium]